REIKKSDSHVPIVFLTAKALAHDKIEGFKIGADDYITKPFSMEELILRIKAILKRSGKFQPALEVNTYTIGKFIFEYENRLLKQKDEEIKLTSKESDLLNLLCINKNKVLNRSEALQLVWQEDNYFTARSMDVYITKLRSYLKADPSIEIVNVHGTGFKLHIK
ncbi:response regulator transcription factor, partial [Candidatus Nomurabacteria bacterium]|nr:response regulator transcription factor [Candidatus Nomurabacteria bacterium]